ncbi:GntP family permease [Sabulicella glaciei]|uniref:GntP family permease n=1 Tax=Sabulicella glaciei TaxID=2984948 RepID=A0ABT3P3I2_9PROT|nr:GntP family permease [Roseococcus sp. MDT2-1-1]MCW8088344.1 GntP family permease [Roseococcus sp. MDT2-1-1]
MGGLAGILLALGLLIVLSWRGVSVLLLAPAAAALAALLSGAPVLASYTQIFMPALGSFVAAFLPLFLLGAVFGRLMEETGAAQALARAITARLGEGRTILAVVLACAVLTYGGVSLFVVAFAVQPLAAAMFSRARLPATLIPASIALGAFTFTMTALPGTPAIQNAIPMPHFGTTAFAAPGAGVLAGAIMLGLGLLWLNRRVAAHAFATPGAPPPPLEGTEAPSAALAALPNLLVVSLNLVLASAVLPALDTAYLAEVRFGGVEFAALRGVWAIILALLGAIALMAWMGRRRVPDLPAALGRGANAALLPALNTASLVGFGAVVAALPAFAAIRDAVLGIAPGNPLISLAVAVNILAGITGSASGGLSIALQTLGATYLERGVAAGIDPALLHRVAAIATGGLDALPHNGAVVTLLAVCGMTHRQSYADIFVVACLIPLLALAAVLAVTALTGAF